ncbi:MULTISPECIES: DUF2541 family protein [Aeromonas]|uniref:DUF2541 family protein n=1 Tax=Aeromonas TaxID=642 RepID=UPI0005C19ADA|nr:MULTISPECIES: DUF2541 family protein [Aeromonas]MCO4205137.1 DUF2541 family protein [Aeromonas taiwanensis]
MSVLSVSSFSRRGLAACLLSTLLWVPASPALADDEFRLGKTILLGVGDHPAIIPMLACRPTKSIMVKAGRELTLERVKVFYGSDRSKTLYFDRDLKEDQESGWKSLGSRLCIKRIEVYGNSEGSRAGVRVYGRK